MDVCKTGFNLCNNFAGGTRVAVPLFINAYPCSFCFDNVLFSMVMSFQLKPSSGNAGGLYVITSFQL